MIETSLNPALQFSGGKDSLACLYLLEPFWEKLTVIWGNAGDAFPETLEQVEAIRSKVKAVHIVNGHSFNDPNGWPVDMIPIRSTSLGMAIEPEGRQIRLQSRYDCCRRNFWEPMANAVKELGFDLLIRGQRDDEKLRAPIENGVVDPNSGARIWLPIKTWTEGFVKAFLASKGVKLPAFYEDLGCSIDCMHCTAYLHDTRGKVGYLRKRHPSVAKEYERRLGLVAQAIKPDIDELTTSLVEIEHV